MSTRELIGIVIGVLFALNLAQFMLLGNAPFWSIPIVVFAGGFSLTLVVLKALRSVLP